jgi:hypothetical protein
MKKAFLLIAAVMVLAACSDTNSDNESNHTLIIKNSTNKDLIIFKGEASAANRLGVIRAFSTKILDLDDDVPGDVSDDTDDFQDSGYFFLRGITREEYKVNKSNLAQAKTAYLSLVAYGQNKNSRTEINSSNYMGDYMYRTSYARPINIELRKDGTDIVNIFGVRAGESG